jgi:catechol 2,3-dioxygenase-like lactoylglutathione lyase family enzyme
MGIGMTKVLHVKIPVTDLQRSVSWYCAFLELDLSMEFVEQGVLRGAALSSREGGFAFALRDREFCASRPNLAGFDPFALHISTRAALEEIVERCDRLGLEHSPIQERGPNEAVVDVPDPDGTVLRFYWVGEGADGDHFVGLAFDDNDNLSFYDTPRLRVPGPV